MSEAMLPYLTFTLNGRIYINASLPFSAASSCLIFEKVASALQWIVTNEMGCHWISHFLDDFPLLGKSYPSLEHFMADFYAIMQAIGMPVAIRKTLGPTQVLEYLSLVLNFVSQTVGIPEKKRLKCLRLVNKLIDAHASGEKVTVKTIQWVAGSLNFIIQALPMGRPFLASLYRLTCTVDGGHCKSGHHRRITQETCDDMKVFTKFLDEKADNEIKTLPFLNKLQIFNDQLEFFVDAAGAENLGFGAYFQGRWCQGRWRDTTIFSHSCPNIALLELYTIVIAVETWAPEIAGKSVVLRTDNTATVSFINCMRGDIPTVMILLSYLALTCLSFQILVKAVHIRGVNNINSNLIS